MLPFNSNKEKNFMTPIKQKLKLMNNEIIEKQNFPSHPTTSLSVMEPVLYKKGGKNKFQAN